ncbi:hypothetical protein [Haloarcula brevis]|uniref:hypothetical protein n=1 Tax=Haloarcula brevis TaxID=3111453 RepID=UPI00300F15A4
MTSTEIYATGAVDSDPPPRTRSKTALFCPACGHESAVTGDWTVESTEHSHRLRCPECDSVVKQR